MAIKLNEELLNGKYVDVIDENIYNEKEEDASDLEAMKKIYDELNPQLTIFVANNLTSLTNEVMAYNVAKAVDEFYTDIKQNLSSMTLDIMFNKWNGKKIVNVYRNEFRKLEIEWSNEVSNDDKNIVIKPTNKKDIENIISEAMVKDEHFAATVCGDIVVDNNYPFIVNNKEIAELLLNNEGTKLIKIDETTGNVLLTRKQIVCGYLFNNIDEDKK